MSDPVGQAPAEGPGVPVDEALSSPRQRGCGLVAMVTGSFPDVGIQNPNCKKVGIRGAA